MIVYVAKNKSDNMTYVGQTILSLDQRKRNHMKSVRRGSTFYFHNALRKHGVDGFEWRVVCEVNNKTCLDNYETFYIKEFKCLAPNGYNLKTGGSSCVFTNEEKLKMSLAHRGKKLSEEHKRKMSESQMGRAPTNAGVPHTSEHKQKISESLMGEKNPFYGKKHTEESRHKISEAGKGRIDTDETRKRKSESIKLWWSSRK